MFDQMEIARDLVRRDEAEHLFTLIRNDQRDVENDPDGWYDREHGDDAAYTRGGLFQVSFETQVGPGPEQIVAEVLEMPTVASGYGS